MMNKTKFFLNLLLVPVYFTLLVLFGIIRVVKESVYDTMDAIRVTKRMYW